MGSLILMALVILLTLGALAYLADKQDVGQDEGRPNDEKPVYALLPGDIKYESPNGNFRFYFPVTTSIVLSVVLTLVLWLFS